MLPDAVILTQKDFLAVLTWLIWKQLVRGRHSAGNFYLAQTKAEMMAGSSAQTKAECFQMLESSAQAKVEAMVESSAETKVETKAPCLTWSLSCGVSSGGEGVGVGGRTFPRR